MLKHFARRLLQWREPSFNRADRPIRPFFESLEDRSVPATFTWFLGGAQAGNWNDQNNWRDENMNAGVPGANDAVVFEPNGNQGTAPVTVNVNATIKQILIRSTYNATITLTNRLTVNSGQATQVTSEMAGGTIAGAATFEVTNAVLRWTGGTIDGAGVLFINQDASLDIEGNNAKTLDRRTLRNWGTVNWSGSGEIRLRNAARLQIGTIGGDDGVLNINASNTALKTPDKTPFRHAICATESSRIHETMIQEARHGDSICAGGVH